MLRIQNSSPDYIYVNQPALGLPDRILIYYKY